MKIKNNERKSKQLFIIIYKLIMNQSSGPRIPLLIHVVGVEKFITLLDFKSSKEMQVLKGLSTCISNSITVNTFSDIRHH